MIRLVKIVLFMGFFVVGKTLAACVVTGTPVSYTTDLGRVVVDPSLAVGALIKEMTWTVGNNNQDMFLCSTAGDLIYRDVVMTNLTGSNGTIYQTNIPGVGIQFQRGNNVYPGVYKSPQDNYIIYLSTGPFTVRLYKTAEYVGSGPIKAGAYTMYGPDSNLSTSALTTYMSENGTVIVAPSCSVSGGSEQNVYLSSVNYKELKTIGATAGETPFSIQLRCSGGASVDVGYDNVNLTFSGTVPQGLNSTDGVLANSKNSSDAASGVGIQILDNSKQPLVFDKQYKVGSLANASTDYLITSNYIARYYRYLDKITPGEIESKMIYNISYD